MTGFSYVKGERLPVVVFKAAKVALSRVERFFDTMRLRLLFACNGIEAGRGLKAIGIPSVNKSLGGRASFGDMVTIRTGVAETEIGMSGGRIRIGSRGTLRVGNHVGMSNATIVCENSVTIGNRVLIGGGTQVFDTNFHSTDATFRCQPAKDRIGVRTEPVLIEDDVFIGANVLVCKGVTIGKGSIIAAGSVVVSSVPPGEVWGGNPARKIK